jgi:hypothetical protein
MGYYTTFKLKATGFKDIDEAEFFEFKLRKLTGYTGWETNSFETEMEGSLSDAKWYDYEAHMTELSKQFPHVYFDLDGVGEEHGDVWKMRAKDGQTERVNAKIVFPEFTILT